jgi:class 3 adenylate cyclase
MDRLSVDVNAYVPNWVRTALAEGRFSSSAPVVESGFAAVLLLDVAGFVETTNRLARRGLNGAEEISNLLNRSFGSLTDIIRDHGGDVIAFAGDGMLAMWNDTPRIDEAAHLAAQCGLALKGEMYRQAVSGQHQLRVRISAEVGEIHCCKLGGLHDRSCFVVVGSPIECLGDAYRRANVGDVVLGNELHCLIRGHCEGTISDGLFVLNRLSNRKYPPKPALSFSRRAIPKSHRASWPTRRRRAAAAEALHQLRSRADDPDRAGVVIIPDGQALLDLRSGVGRLQHRTGISR